MKTRITSAGTFLSILLNGVLETFTSHWFNSKLIPLFKTSMSSSYINLVDMVQLPLISQIKQYESD